MKLSAEQKQSIVNYLENPADGKSRQGLHGIFWGTLMEALSDTLNGSGDLSSLFKEQFDFINFGLCAAALKEAPARGKELQAAVGNNPFCQIRLFTEWLDEIVRKVNKGDEKEMLERDIKLAEISIRRITEEITVQQERRKDLLIKNVGEAGRPPSPVIIKQIESMQTTDTLVLESMRIKRSIAHGMFFSVDQKRQHVARETAIQKEAARNDSLVTGIKAKENVPVIRALAAKLAELFTQLLDAEDSIAKKKQSISDIQKRQQGLSAIEIESRIRTELEYVRDLVMLASKRLHQESCPFLRLDEKCFTVKEISECLDRVLEFDPRVLNNDRASIFGKPGIVLIPGSGNALFDWKNNMIIVPLIPPAGNCMASIATAMIEYRLDVDEDKKLMSSYNQIPDNKDIRSIFELRTKLTHDYITWMTSEYKGYRVLGKDVKKWFDYEIAPDRNEVFAPPPYQQFALAAADYKKAAAELETALEGDLDKCSLEDIWHGSIVAFQNGKFPRAVELLQFLLKKNPDHVFAYFNLGQTCLRTMRKTEAIAAFGEFAKRHGQSWWSNVAREHLVRLQRG